MGSSLAHVLGHARFRQTSPAIHFDCGMVQVSDRSGVLQSPPTATFQAHPARTLSRRDRLRNVTEKAPPSTTGLSAKRCSEPSTKPSSPAPSLADLLARDPPPLPSEGRYTPAVWLHIGPSNRGFGMLQRSRGPPARARSTSRLVAKPFRNQYNQAPGSPAKP